MSTNIKRDGHLAAVSSDLTLAAIEQQLRREGYDQEAIDNTLAFVIEAREALKAAGKLPRTRPQ